MVSYNVAVWVGGGRRGGGAATPHPSRGAMRCCPYLLFSVVFSARRPLTVPFRSVDSLVARGRPERTCLEGNGVSCLPYLLDILRRSQPTRPQSTNPGKVIQPQLSRCHGRIIGRTGDHHAAHRLRLVQGSACASVTNRGWHLGDGGSHNQVFREDKGSGRVCF